MQQSTNNPTSAAAPARVVLLSRTATTAAPLRELETLRAATAQLPGVSAAAFAFIEEGTPSLRAVLRQWSADNSEPIVIVPLMLPVEANFTVWLKRSLARWRRETGGAWPEIRLAPGPAGQPALLSLLQSLIGAPDTVTLDAAAPAPPEASIVPAQKRRVLVCMGGPCRAAGASVIWGHLRNEQQRLSLRTAGDGAMTAKTTCLGPCGLAPVVQVWPEGTNYGGVDEYALDRIIVGHLLKGEVVADLAYAPTGARQWLR